MKLPIHVGIYTHSISLTANQRSASHAVDFLYSLYLYEENVTTENFTKVAVMLNDIDVAWDGDLRDRVAVIYQAFSPPHDCKDNLEKLQIYVLDTVCLALRKLSGSNAIPLCVIDKCRVDLLRDGFIQVVQIAAAVDRKKLQISHDLQARIRLKTGALRYQYVLELSNLSSGKIEIFPLVSIKPSWLLARADFKKWSLISNKKTLVLTLKHPRQIDPPYASYLELNAVDGKYYDEQVCELPISKTISEDLITFEFDITELKRGSE